MEQFFWTIVLLLFLALAVGAGLTAILGASLLWVYTFELEKKWRRILYRAVSLLIAFFVFTFCIYLNNGNEPQWVKQIGKAKSFLVEKSSPVAKRAEKE